MDNQIDIKDSMRQDCLNSALHTLGTSYIYTLKSTQLRKRLKFNNFLGIVIPVLIGAIATTYKTEYLTFVISLLAPLTIIQLVLSVFSMAYNWEDNYSFYLESSNENANLSADYHELFKYTPTRMQDFKVKKDILDIKRNNRSTNDNKHPLSDIDKRKGMRYGLRNFQRSCAGCKQVPIDMKSTNCGVCGNF